MKLHSYFYNIARVLKILCLWKWYTVFILCFLCPEDCRIHLLSYILSHMKPATNAILLMNSVTSEPTSSFLYVFKSSVSHLFLGKKFHLGKALLIITSPWKPFLGDDFVSTIGSKWGSVHGKPYLSSWLLHPALWKSHIFMVSFILWLFMNPSYVTPMEEKSLEEWASGLCLKHFVGAGMAGAQGSQPGQTGEGQKMKFGCLLNSFMPSPTH